MTKEQINYFRNLGRDKESERREPLPSGVARLPLERREMKFIKYWAARRFSGARVDECVPMSNHYKSIRLLPLRFEWLRFGSASEAPSL